MLIQINIMFKIRVKTFNSKQYFKVLNIKQMQTKRSVLDKSPMPLNEIANIRKDFENKPQSTSVD